MRSDDASRRRILVTGARGFLGRHSVHALLARGHSVAALYGGSPNNGAALAAEYPTTFTGLDAGRGISHAAIERWSPDTLVHLGSFVPSSRQSLDPCDELAAACEGVIGSTISAVQEVRASVRHVVFASSVSVYGATSDQMLHEGAVCRPDSPYGIFKLAAEQAVAWASSRLGCPTTLLRFCEMYGPGEPHGRFLQRVFIPRALAGEPITLIHGGREEKTLLWVEDAALAIAVAVDRRAGGTFNIAPESVASVLALAQAVVRASGREGGIVMTDDGCDVPAPRYSVERARAELGFVAHTSIEEGIRRLCK